MTSPGETPAARFEARQTQKDASPAIFLSGPSNFLFPQMKKAGYSFTRAILGERETLMRSLDLSRENPMMRTARYDLAIAKEIKEMNRTEFLEQKRRQQLLQNSGELRELSEHLKLAAISKDLYDHKNDFYKSPLQLEREKAESRRQAEIDRQQFIFDIRRKEMAKKEQQKNLRDTLALQIKEHQQRRKEESLRTLADLERRMVMQQKMEDEDKAKKEHNKQEKIRKRLEIQHFIEEKSACRESSIKQAKIELKKVIATQNQLDERQNKLDQKCLKIKRKKEEISAELGRQVCKVESDKRQRDNLLLDLLESEYNAKSEEYFRQKLELETMIRKRTKEELDAYRFKVLQHDMVKRERKRREVAARKANSMIKQDVINKEERFNEHQKRKHNGAVLLSMIKDNQRKRAEAKAENVQYSNMKAKSEKELEERIQRERFEMLNTVPASVLRFLPSHVLSDADRKHFGVEDQKKMGAGDV